MPTSICGGRMLIFRLFNFKRMWVKFSASPEEEIKVYGASELKKLVSWNGFGYLGVCDSMREGSLVPPWCMGFQKSLEQDLLRPEGTYPPSIDFRKLLVARGKKVRL